MAGSTILVVSKPNDQNLRLLAALPRDTRIVVGNVPDAFRSAAPEADVLLHCVAPGLPLSEVFHLAPNLKWIHVMAAGLDNILFPEILSSSVPLTNGRGVFSRSLGEWVVAAMLFFSKNLRHLVLSQQAGAWDQRDVEELHGAALGIVGYGDIGRCAARLAKAFGMTVLALRRSPDQSAGDGIADRLYPPSGLHEMLAVSDYVLLAAPLTPGSRDLIGEQEIRCMKPTAVLVNVGRGPVVNEAALIQALQQNRIRGAALDVFNTEPLPAGHPFYSLENVLLSPHCADHTQTWQDDAMRFFLENFARYRAGQPLLNIVEKSRGY
jgi:phosphoglycerate dehydrogenase-like enzyme